MSFQGIGNLSIRRCNQLPGAAFVHRYRRSSASMSSSRLFLSGMLSSSARLRFTGRAQNAIN
ncbi:MAG: hypothetical protein ACP5M4_10360 [Acidobacteriaceae bacterium]